MLDSAELGALNLRVLQRLGQRWEWLIVLRLEYHQRESGQGVWCSRISLPALVLYFVYPAK
jgi:hypothetical protein